MAEYIDPVIDHLVTVLKARTPDLLRARKLDAIAQWQKTFTGVFTAMPAICVLGISSAFDDEEQGLLGERHLVTLRIAVNGPDPETIAERARMYMRVVNAALDASWPADWSGVDKPYKNGVVERMFVAGHDYGPVFQARAGNAMVAFPEMSLIFDVQEAL